MTDKQRAYEQAINPPRKPVTAEEFDQILYDTIWRNRATMSPVMVKRWAEKNYEVRGASDRRA